MPDLKRKAAYLCGKITKGEKGALLKLQVKPNSILPIFAIISTFMSVVIALKAVSITEYDLSFLILGVFFIALGIIYYLLSRL